MYRKYSALLLLASSFLAAALPRPDIGDPVNSGLPADVQERVDSNELDCVEVVDGVTCSDRSGASFFVREDTNNDSANNAAVNRNDANTGNPGPLPADVQERVDSGELDCEFDGEVTVCTDQFGGGFIVRNGNSRSSNSDNNNNNNNNTNNNASNNASNGAKNNSANNGTTDDATNETNNANTGNAPSLPADVQERVDSGELDCDFDGEVTVCTDQFGGGFIVRD
ncbi:hypothetical protein JX266_008042 [Neoarthrinium moseri]|nr:hypothetical protein JX266_008042 [Neoarthrinium moseri]